jgi:hypothetical protein
VLVVPSGYVLQHIIAAMRCVLLCAADADEGAFFLLRAM